MSPLFRLSVTASLLLLGVPALCDTINVVEDPANNGKKVKITVTAPASLPIASVHVSAPASGVTPDGHTEPQGWTYLGYSAGDSYGWESATNVSGTFEFTITRDIGLLTLPSSISIDYLDENDKRQFYKSDQVTPEPGTYILAGAGLAALACIRKRRSRSLV